MKRDYIDLAYIPIHQDAIHKRLENWALSLRSSAGSSTTPMFRLYSSDEVWEPDPIAVPVDQQDASKIAKGVANLPDKHRGAVNWFYVTRGSPIEGRRALGCTLKELHGYVIDGRQMLINRRT